MIESNENGIDLDIKGVYKYNQRKRKISPSYSCFTNNLCQAYEIYCQSEDCWDNVKNYHTEFTSVADKFMYFCRFEPMITEMYKFYYPKEYNTWFKDKKKDEWLYSDDSCPPNEMFKIVCIAFNLFISINKKDDYDSLCYISSLDENQIKYFLYNELPIVASFQLGELGHIMTVKGYNKEGFLVYDTYACKYLSKYKNIGNAKLIPYEDFKKLCKPTDKEFKNCICFEGVICQ